MTSYKGYILITNEGWSDSKDIYGICFKQVNDELHVFGKITYFLSKQLIGGN